MTKICKYCKKEFTPMKPDHYCCHDCWMKHEYIPPRTCVNCGRPIGDHPIGHNYCTECNSKIFHGGK